MGGSSSTAKTEEQPAAAATTEVAEAKYAEEKKAPEPAPAALSEGLAAGQAAVFAGKLKASAAKHHEEKKDEAAPAAPSSPDTKPAAEGEEKKEKKDKKGKGKKKGEEKAEGGKKGKGGKEGKGKGKAFEPPTGPTGSGSGYRLNVKSLADDIKEEDLKKHFAEFGTVETAQVKTYDNGKSRGYGFVVMSNEEEAQKAIAAMNGKEVNGKAMSVLPAERRQVEGDGADGKGGKDGKGKGKGKGKDGKKGGKGDYTAQQQQAAAAAYMQQYHQYMLLMAAYYQQQQAAGGYPYSAGAAAAAGGDGAKGPSYEGSLKSLSAKKGYGFIVNAETFKLYERDVYVDKDVLPEGAKVADRLIFTVELNEKGHPRAATCEFALPPSA